MVGAIQRSMTGMETNSMARASSPVTTAQPTVSQNVPDLSDQVSDVAETQNDTAEAMLQAQVSIFKEALDMGQGMAGAVLQMLNPAQAFQGGGNLIASSGSALNIKA
jgi:hypothetical protein